MEKFQEYTEKIYDLIITYGLKFLLAIVVLVIGLIIIRLLTRSVTKLMKRSNVDASLIPFLRSMFNFLLKALLIISVMGMVGIQMTSLLPSLVQPVLPLV